MDSSVQALSAYQTFTAPRPLLVVLSGPSGVGKDSTMSRLREMGVEFYQVVTATTRAKRPAEVDGVDYHFLSMNEFAGMIEAEELLEHAIVYGDYKGIPKAEVRKGLESGRDVVLRVDVQGVETVQRMVPQAVTIFLMASSDDEMVRRLRERRTEDFGMLAMRIATSARGDTPGQFLQVRGHQPGRLAGRHRASGDGHHGRRALPGRLADGGPVQQHSGGRGRMTDQFSEQPPSAPELRVRIPLVKARWTYVLMVAIGLVFAAMTGLGLLVNGDLSGTQNNAILVLFGAQVNEYIAAGEFYRLLTSMFIHIGFVHLGFNLWALYVIGQGVEQTYGGSRFLLIYFLSGLGGSLFTYVLGGAGISAGASGAIFGLIGAQIAFFYRQRAVFGDASKAQLRNLLMVAGFNLVFGFTVPGINNLAHIGGLIFGAVVGWLLSPRYQPPQVFTPDDNHAITLEDGNGIRQQMPALLAVLVVMSALLYFGTTTWK